MKYLIEIADGETQTVTEEELQEMKRVAREMDGFEGWRVVKQISEIPYFDDPANDRLATAERLLRDLTDLQNGPPLETHRKEWEQTMKEIDQFFGEE